ncbi:MAG: hypothetical protein LBC96_04290 [Lachnospiraceae bacterium]|jgi:hypothetical protein|nr:hypothetical protein [Lachnospiraceae bacterium]
MVTWLSDNKEWLFSGVGLFLAIQFVHWIINKIMNTHKNKSSITTAVEIINEVNDAYSNLFEKIESINGKRHINLLRIYATNSSTKAQHFINNMNLSIDECIIMLRKLPKNHELHDDFFDTERETLKKEWSKSPNIKKLTIVEYDRISDFWYIICDDRALLTDFLLENSVAYNKQGTNRMPILSTDKAFISRYIYHFENHKDYFEKRGLQEK